MGMRLSKGDCSLLFSCYLEVGCFWPYLSMPSRIIFESSVWRGLFKLFQSLYVLSA